jgi:hypothetical protein
MEDVTVKLFMGYYSQTLNCVIACEAHHGRARERASTNASHPSTTITTSIEVEEPSQPSCCAMFATLPSLSSRAGYPALCTRVLVKQG